MREGPFLGYPKPSPAVAGRDFRGSKGGGIRRQAGAGGHEPKIPPGRGGALQVTSSTIPAQAR